MACRIIISLTSYPARIPVVPRVLESLYAQSMAPDKIVLWLAREQFPRREAELPQALVDDVAAGKLELRWCDDLGSHKKYFYAMQEFEDDIVITVDDDVLYHPDTVKILFELHCAFPGCITAWSAKLILIDGAGRLVPYRKWPFSIKLDHPSIQLIPMGGGGVLYPPRSIDKAAFDKEAILSHCTYNGVICGDDLWLKSHAILAGTPTVVQRQYHAAQRTVREVQSTAIGQLDVLGQRQMDQIIPFLLERHGVRGSATVLDFILVSHAENAFLDRSSDEVVRNMYSSVIESLRTRIDAAAHARPEEGMAVTAGALHVPLRRFCVAMALDESELYETYTEELRTVFLSVPNVDELERKSIYIRAFIEHSAVLQSSLGTRFIEPEYYLQMLENWRHFLRAHPDCKQEYLRSYASFLRDMMRSCEIMEERDGKSDAIRACRTAVESEWKLLSLRLRIRERLKENRLARAVVSRLRKAIRR